MKRKKVLIVFFNNGDLKHLAEKELLHKKLVEELESEGREVYTTSEMLGIKTTTYQDGTTVTSCGYKAYLRGGRYTHIYMDKRLKELDNNILSNTENFFLLTGENDSWETSGDRVFTYRVDGNNIKIEKY